MYDVHEPVMAPVICTWARLVVRFFNPTKYTTGLLLIYHITPMVSRIMCIRYDILANKKAGRKEEIPALGLWVKTPNSSISHTIWIVTIIVHFHRFPYRP